MGSSGAALVPETCITGGADEGSVDADILPRRSIDVDCVSECIVNVVAGTGAADLTGGGNDRADCMLLLVTIGGERQHTGYQKQTDAETDENGKCLTVLGADEGGEGQFLFHRDSPFSCAIFARSWVDNTCGAKRTYEGTCPNLTYNNYYITN